MCFVSFFCAVTLILLTHRRSAALICSEPYPVNGGVLVPVPKLPFTNCAMHDTHICTASHLYCLITCIRHPPTSVLAQAVTAINLVNQHGSEGQLERAFRKESKRYAAERQAPWHYVAFDFHKECGAANYGRLAVLWEAVKADFYKYRMFLQV